MRKLPSLKQLALALAVTGSAAALPAHAAPGEIGLTGAVPDLKSVQLDSPHVYDYTFSSAPTDWRLQSGVWEMTNRWSCSPGWSWFGGRSDEVAAIWNKRKLAGDVSAQMYFAFKMGMSGVREWPEYPSDAAISICGDGQNLGSGYVFIAGADDNTRSILIRNGKIVAESKAPAAILPRLTDKRPGNEDVHRRWWYMRLDKTGNKVEARLDNQVILTYTDPEPIAGGQSAVWTYNNGIMLARVQLFFEKENRAIYARRDLAPAETPSIVNVSRPAAPPAKPSTPARTAPPAKPTLAQRDVSKGKME